MPVSRRLRYEILRRDNHTCRYCGATAPVAPLTVDHVVPVTLGGTDDPTNLVAACKDCNCGKSSSSPDQPLVDDVNADALRWGRAMEAVAAQRVADRQALDRDVSTFDERWLTWTVTFRDGSRAPVPRDSGWRDSVRRFLRAGLEVETLFSLMSDAMECELVKAEYTWRSFCRRSWDEINARQVEAQQLLAQPAPAAPSVRSRVRSMLDAALDLGGWDLLMDALAGAFPDLGPLAAKAPDYPTENWMLYLNATDSALYLFQRCLERKGGITIGHAQHAELVAILADVVPRMTYTPAGPLSRLFQELARALVRQALVEADLDPGLVDEVTQEEART